MSTSTRLNSSHGQARSQGDQGNEVDPLLGPRNPQMPSYVNGQTTGSADEFEVDPIPSKHAKIDDQDLSEHLKRGLSARQVQMIALAGTIGTGLFLGTGKSLAEGELLCMTIKPFKFNYYH